MRSLKKVLIFVAATIGLVLIARRRAEIVPSARRGLHGLVRRMRYWEGRLQGLRYRLTSLGPDPDVSDDVLADRIRSSLGRVEKHLDAPRVHVMVEDHVALLHGDVPSSGDAVAIECAVADMPGVRGVESHLHVGLTPGETVPSEGRALARGVPSRVMRELLDAACRAGAEEDGAGAALRAVLSTFADLVPPDEREQLLAHVPEDVRALAAAARRLGEQRPHLRTVPDLTAAIGARVGIDDSRTLAITETVLAHLRQHVPEEVTDVAAVLPVELRTFWCSAVPG